MLWMKILFFWDMTPEHWVIVAWHFKEHTAEMFKGLEVWEGGGGGGGGRREPIAQ